MQRRFGPGRRRIVGTRAARTPGYLRGMSARARVAWLAPVFLLAAVLLGAWIVLARPLSLFVGLLVVLATVPVGWVIVSSLWPARAERACPACRADALARIDPR